MSKLVLGGYYRHYKNKPYKVLDIVRHSESLELLALYQTLYKNESGSMWVRPLAMFEENVMIEGKSVARFAFEAPPTLFKYYHTHIYFTQEQSVQALSLKEKMQRELGDKVQAHRLHHEPIGPHPLPMFEADCLGENYLTVVNWLIANRGDLKVLIHPLSGNAMDDHTVYAQFLGEKLPLDLSVLG